MGTKRKPSLDDAGKIVYYYLHDAIRTVEESAKSYQMLDREIRKSYIKTALQIWQEVEKAI